MQPYVRYPVTVQNVYIYFVSGDYNLQKTKFEHGGRRGGADADGV